MGQQLVPDSRGLHKFLFWPCPDSWRFIRLNQISLLPPSCGLRFNIHSFQTTSRDSTTGNGKAANHTAWLISSESPHAPPHRSCRLYTCCNHDESQPASLIRQHHWAAAGHRPWGHIHQPESGPMAGKATPPRMHPEYPVRALTLPA